ncbi:MAG: M20/M25/M40 family metallo-hydrolase [Bacteroidales bacterium]|nr:M20/M25/M40 family metallo-hydrolase [Bacteroidales bacterium]
MTTKDKKVYPKLTEIPKHLVDVYMTKTQVKEGNYYNNFYTDMKATIIRWLDAFQKGNYTLTEDETGNIYVAPKSSKNANIVLAAHMDMVHTNGHPKQLYYEEQTGKLWAINKDKKQTSLGADDKNGIFVILEVYRTVKPDELPSVVFTVDEECGCLGSSAIDEKFFEDKDHCIVIDRRNQYDLIYKGSSTVYGVTTPPLFKTLNPQFKFTTGSISDANQFSEFVDCINVSCGYYNPHGSTEYTQVDELLETADAVKTFVLNANTTKTSKEANLEFLGLFNTTTSYYNSWYNTKSSTTTTKKSTKPSTYYEDYWDDYYGVSDNYWNKYNDPFDKTCPVCGLHKCYDPKSKTCWFCGDITKYAGYEELEKEEQTEMTEVLK